MKAESPDTIFALSSGSPPAAVAIVRISGPDARAALKAMTGRLPEPRRASRATLRHPESNEVLDHALVLRFDGPGTATGEDVCELHLHGGRSVVAAVLEALASLAGLRSAQPGEFTRRAFENGRIDLTEAEGLGDLLRAETQSQRRAALALAGGALSRAAEDWRGRLLALNAQVEAVLDFGEEQDLDEELPKTWHQDLSCVVNELQDMLTKPGAERLRDGVRVVIAGPTNAGKSTLFNALVGRDAAITSDTPGTTRDVLEAPVSLQGVPLLLIDTAGLRDSADMVEALGVERAYSNITNADVVLWLGGPDDAPDGAIRVQSKADIAKPAPDVDATVSGVTGTGLSHLTSLLLERAKALLPAAGSVALNRRQREALLRCFNYLGEAAASDDILIIAESLRIGRDSLDAVTGRAGVEQMLDALFGNFCIGK